MKAPRYSLDDLPKSYREQAAQQMLKDRSSDPSSNLEQASSSKPVAEKEDKRPHPCGRCAIHVHSVRKRLCDPDGISAKASIDGLVHVGILRSDQAEEVSQVTYSQKKGNPEKTTITLIWDE